jgi:hypothetical protein
MMLDNYGLLSSLTQVKYKSVNTIHSTIFHKDVKKNEGINWLTIWSSGGLLRRMFGFHKIGRIFTAD